MKKLSLLFLLLGSLSFAQKPFAYVNEGQVVEWTLSLDSKAVKEYNKWNTSRNQKVTALNAKYKKIEADFEKEKKNLMGGEAYLRAREIQNAYNKEYLAIEAEFGKNIEPIVKPKRAEAKKVIIRVAKKLGYASVVDNSLSRTSAVLKGTTEHFKAVGYDLLPSIKRELGIRN